MNQDFIIFLIVFLVCGNVALFCFNKDGFNHFGKFIISFAALIIVLTFLIVMIEVTLKLNFLEQLKVLVK
jgi:uncharacterized membrane protein